MENKWKQWISGFGKKGKLPAKQQLLILLLAGILLVVVVTIITFAFALVFAAILTREKIKGHHFLHPEHPVCGRHRRYLLCHL